MKKKLTVSVVINTYNRAKSLKVTLESLYHQTVGDFEVIIVNGPSTDETEEVVSAYKERIKYIVCPDRNLSVSRNLGIEAASGEIVAFIDDDAIADPNWIKDLIDAYNDVEIGGAGGLVYDHTGMKLQYRYSSCDRMGDTDFSIIPPFSQYCVPFGEKFLYLQGTNCSFRKSCLEEVGGFDEEFEYYLDEVDVCMRIIDLGYKIKPLDNAIVHHKYMQSFLRNEKKVVLHPYSTVKNRYYFAIKNNRNKNIDEIIKKLNDWKGEVIAGGNWNLLNGKMNQAELNVYLDEVEKAGKDGLQRGQCKAKTRKLNMSSDEEFLKFPTVPRNERILKICYLSKEYPPKNFGGIGRYTYDLATTFAAKGHEVHVITEGEEQDTVDFEEGVWVHRLVSKLYEPFSDMTLGWNFSLQARNYFELERIQEQGPIDIVNGPIWLCESGMANCSNKYPVILTLMTTQKILNGLTGMPLRESHPYKLMELEECTIRQHGNIHAISQSIMANCKESMQEGVNVFIAPLGCRDLSMNYTPDKDMNKIIVYSVGRLEHRKGTDLLLQAAENILSDERYKNVEFRIAGKETVNTISGVSYKEEFLKRNANKPEILCNVKFLGEVTEDELMQNYANADIACTPSRYESFGIVLLEGMSFSNAIVAAEVGGMKDIVKDGKTGLFFEAGNAKDLTIQLKELIDNREYCINMAKEARKEYEEIYSLDAVYKTLYAKYTEVINNCHVTESSTFDLAKYAKMIAESENISIEIAEEAVDKLLKDHMVLENSVENDEEIKLSWTLRILRKIYRILKNICPTLAVRIRNYLLVAFYRNGQIGFKKGAFLFFSKIYHHVIKLPIIGWLIWYIMDILLIPVRMEFAIHNIIKLQNNDELLKQIGDMAQNISSSTKDIVWKVESEMRSLQDSIEKLTRDGNEKEKRLVEEWDILTTNLGKINSGQESIEELMRDMFEKGNGFIEKLDRLTADLVKINNGIESCLSGKSSMWDSIECLKNEMIEGNNVIQQIQQLLSTSEYEDRLSNSMHYDIENYSNQIVDKLNKRLTDVRSEILFEFLRNQSGKKREEITESKIINKDKVRKALQEKTVKLNLGAGHICFGDFINIDEREINNIDIVADVRKVPFEKETVMEIYASHIIEHFTKNEFVSIILPYWCSLLINGGTIKVILPDLEAMIKYYNEKRYDINDMREVLYGLQEYPGDIHYALYGYQELKKIFENCGLEATYAFTERKNGKCYDMELVGVKRDELLYKEDERI